MGLYRKKPVVIEARKYNRNNGEELAKWCNGISYDAGMAPGMPHHISIPTLEGTMNALPGDWIIKGVQDEFYPCKSDIFEATYEAVLE
jgi:hypothetical protein